MNWMRNIIIKAFLIGLILLSANSFAFGEGISSGMPALREQVLLNSTWDLIPAGGNKTSILAPGEMKKVTLTSHWDSPTLWTPDELGRKNHKETNWYWRSSH